MIIFQTKYPHKRLNLFSVALHTSTINIVNQVYRMDLVENWIRPDWFQPTNFLFIEDIFIYTSTCTKAYFFLDYSSGIGFLMDSILLHIFSNMRTSSARISYLSLSTSSLLGVATGSNCLYLVFTGDIL